MIRRIIAFSMMVIVLGFVFFKTGCANLSQVLNQVGIKEPQAQVVNGRLSGLTFEQVDLVFDINIENPNSIGINLDGFDYDFLLNNNSLVSGNQKQAISIEAQGSSRIDFPVSLKFEDMYNLINSLKDADSTGYKMNLGLLFDLPVLGATRIPVSHTGNLPIPKIPSISIKDLKLKSIGLTAAQLELQMRVKNPNAFSMNLAKLDYNFSVNGTEWISGINTNPMQVTKKGEGVVNIPIKLNFLDLGRSVYQLINGNSALNYKLNGSMDMNSSLSVMGLHTIPLDQSGTINLTR